MFAVTIVDGALRWAEHPDPVPGTGEVLVEVHAAGLNSADRAQIAGVYPAPPGSPPDIPGLELAGEVVALGPGAERFAVGDRVMAVVGGGGQAEMCVVHERHLLPIPDGLDWAAGGGFPEAFTTAHDALFTQAGLAMGERLCVHGAAGGGGIAGVQLGVAAGATVVATVRNEALRDQVAAYGAQVVAPEGFGDHARSLEEKAAAARAIERHVLPLLAAGTVSVPVEATYSMADATAAYEHFAAGGKLGKIVLVR